MIGMSGCLLALAVLLTASVAGVSAFMLAVPTAFELLKYRRRRLPDMARHPGVARAGRRSRARCGLAARNGKPLVAVSRRLPGRHQQSQAAGVRRGVLSAIHRARARRGRRSSCVLVATFLAVEASHLRDRGPERARAGALSRASRLAAAYQRLSGMIFAGFGCALLRYRP